MARSKNRLVADWFAKIRANATTGEAEHTDVVSAETTAQNAGVDGIESLNGNIGIGTSNPTENLHIEPSSGNADILLRKYGAGEDARVFIKRKDSTGRAYISYTNEDTIDTWYTGLLRNNNNDLVLGSRSDDYARGVFLMNDDGAIKIARFGSSNPDNTDTSTHRKLEIRANGTADSGGNGTYKRDCFVQHTTGNVQYHWYKITLGSASYGRGSNVKYTANWSTGHASGQGLVDGSFMVRARHDNARVDVHGHKVYNRTTVGGSYYGWTNEPDITVYHCNAQNADAGVYMRVMGYRSSGYDGATIHAIYLEIFGSQMNTANQGIYYVGSSTPADVGTAVSRTILT